MKPPIFDYVKVSTVEDATAILADSSKEAVVIAGGQSLLPMLNFRLAAPDILVDISGIDVLKLLEEREGAVTIGAMARHVDLGSSPIIARHFPVLTEAVTHIAHLAIRNRGTIGGSLCHADPAAELPMMVLLLDAELMIAGVKGPRTIAAKDFFCSALETDIQEGEMLVSINLPLLPPNSGWGFEEVSRKSGDFALAAVCTVLTLNDGMISEIRIAVTGVDDTPRRMDRAEAMLCGKTLDGDLLCEVCDMVQSDINPDTDLQASSDYRRHLVGVLTARVLKDAFARAGGTFV
ncbi:MAG: xanthine dehydrogenase family protein subunit M [Rhizobiales bacterium]|nr:xanthine dehydrogenase family protein subunit M [Hyphomicrobiales bacterium]